MPNRIIKESICTSEEINSLSTEAENLFYRLMVRADDFGCYYGNVKIIKNTCYPLKSDDIKDNHLVSWLNELINVGLVFLYTANDGKQYLKITKWEKHQQKRAKRSKFPIPDDSDIDTISNDIKCNQMITYVPENRESRIENRESRIENTNTKTRAQKDSLDKTQYAENVYLSSEEHQKLVNEYGEDNVAKMIDKLDNYKGAMGKEYKSDYRAILNWVADEIMSKSKKQSKNQVGGNIFLEDDV